MIRNLFTTDRLFSLDIGILILRLGMATLLLIQHGMEKISHFSEMLKNFPDPLGIGRFPSLLFASFTDILCALLILTGTLFRPAVFLIIFNLIVAFVFVHHGNLNAHTEAMILYMTLLLFLMGSGPGRLSIGSLIQRT